MRDRARRRHGRESGQGEKGDERPLLHAGADGGTHPGSSFVVGAGAGVHPRGRVPGGDAEERPAPQSCSLRAGARPPEEGHEHYGLTFWREWTLRRYNVDTMSEVSVRELKNNLAAYL